MNFSCLHPRDQIVATMERIYGRNMTTTSGGNISIHDENGDKWMTPARVDKGSLRRQDIVRIGRDEACDGLHPPSSENPFHLSIYAARPDIRAIIHAHPGALVSFSICGQAPDTRLFPEAWNVCGKVAFARYEVPGSKKLGVRIAAEFASEGRPNCVVLENHGVVVGGRDLAEAFQCFETLEFTAQTILNARQLGEVHYLSDPVTLLRHNGVMVAGRTVLDAFDRLEVLEATAAAIIQSRPLGPMSPMSDEVTRDLLAAFPGL